tara:strand:+ start:243 stop:647 length:405 start_codon:yes stop_codon:yes gene_type:complete
MGLSKNMSGTKLEKSKNAFRTISEVGHQLNLPTHVLRFWETKFSQVRPLKRGGGRRYYRPDDVRLLRHIQVLLYEEGYTIKGVQKLMRDKYFKNFDCVSDELKKPASSDSSLEADIKITIDELEALKLEINSHR